MRCALRAGLRVRGGTVQRSPVQTRVPPASGSWLPEPARTAASTIPRVAALARTLGFRVIAVIDRDKDSIQAETQVSRIEGVCDVVIRLPSGPSSMRCSPASAWMPSSRRARPSPNTASPTRSSVTPGRRRTHLCKVVHKQGLHEQLLQAVYAETAAHPPLIQAVPAVIAALTTQPTDDRPDCRPGWVIRGEARNLIEENRIPDRVSTGQGLYLVGTAGFEPTTP